MITLSTPGHYFLHAFAMGFAIVALCDMGLNLDDRLALHGELEFTAVAEAVVLKVDALPVNREGFRIETSSYAPELGRTADGQVWTYVQLLVLITELLVLAGLLMLLLMSHLMKLTKWVFEEVDDFRKWWDEFKGRRR